MDFDWFGGVPHLSPDGRLTVHTTWPATDQSAGTPLARVDLYQHHLSDIFGERAEGPGICGVWARLHHEPDNPYRANSVAVMVGDRRIGQLADHDADAVFPVIQKRERHGQFVCVPVVITNTGHDFEARLAVAPSDIHPPPPPPPTPPPAPPPPRPRLERYCTNCGVVAYPTTPPAGSPLVLLVLALFFCIPAIIYAVWMATATRPQCRKCGSPNIIPLDSPNAVRALGSAQPSRNP
jgi:hypothetical protein